MLSLREYLCRHFGCDKLNSELSGSNRSHSDGLRDSIDSIDEPGDTITSLTTIFPRSLLIIGSKSLNPPASISAEFSAIASKLPILKDAHSLIFAANGRVFTSQLLAS